MYKWVFVILRAITVFFTAYFYHHTNRSGFTFVQLGLDFMLIWNNFYDLSLSFSQMSQRLKPPSSSHLVTWLFLWSSVTLLTTSVTPTWHGQHQLNTSKVFSGKLLKWHLHNDVANVITLQPNFYYWRDNWIVSPKLCEFSLLKLFFQMMLSTLQPQFCCWDCNCRMIINVSLATELTTLM